MRMMAFAEAAGFLIVGAVTVGALISGTLEAQPRTALHVVGV